MKVLVSAAGGFTGPHLIARLLALGHEVAGITRSVDLLPSRPDGWRCFMADLTERLDLDWHPDAIVHNAAHISSAGRPAADLLHANMLVTKNLIDYAIDQDIGAFIFLSSLSVFGRIEAPIVSEQSPVVSPQPYGLSKLYGEMMLEEVGPSLPSLALRLPGILGPGCSGPWLANVLKTAIDDVDIDIYNGSAPFNNAIHVDDLCRFVASLLEYQIVGADMITLGTIDHLPLSEVVQLIKKQARSHSKIIDRGQRDGAFSIATSKAEDRYGFESMTMACTIEMFASRGKVKSSV